MQLIISFSSKPPYLPPNLVILKNGTALCLARTVIVHSEPLSVKRTKKSSMEEYDEEVPSSSDPSDSSDEFAGESEEEEEEENDDEERSAVKSPTSDEGRKSQNVDALLRSV